MMRRTNTMIAALRRNVAGVALIEFAYAMPVVFAIGLYGIEMANLAVSHLRVSQIALALSDNGSRVGVTSNLSQQQLRESDVNDTLMAAQYQGSRMGLTQNGRVILSSLQVNAQGGQWIAWQRCVGTRNASGYISSYGVQGDGIAGTGFQGMGTPTARVTAPPNSAVIFAEVNYEHRPLIAPWLVPAQRLHYTGSFIVRDRRDLTSNNGQPFNPNPTATPSTCDRFQPNVPTY